MRADIFREIENLQKEMMKMFFPMQENPEIESSESNQDETGGADVRETENSMLAVFELPGVDKKDIELNVGENFVEVKAQKKQQTENETEDAYAYGEKAMNYYKNLPLPKKVETEEAKATYNNGLLRVEIPKKTGKLKESKRVQIE